MTPCLRCQGRPTYCVSCAAAYSDERLTTFNRNVKSPGGPTYLKAAHGPKRFRPADLDSYIARKTKRSGRVVRGAPTPEDVERTRRAAWAASELEHERLGLKRGKA